MTYADALQATKSFYPFDHWRELFFPDEEGDSMEQYSPENCDAAQSILDSLIKNLILIGESANKKEKETLFEEAILSLNNLNDKISGLIETGEREDLCELFDQISITAGLIPADYGRGEGIATEWRNW